MPPKGQKSNKKRKLDDIPPNDNDPTTQHKTTKLRKMNRVLYEEEENLQETSRKVSAGRKSKSVELVEGDEDEVEKMVIDE